MALEASKVLIKNKANRRYLLLRRAHHPRFGNDIDLPGGTVEAGERAVEAAVREVYEEIGVAISQDKLKLLYHGNDYSLNGTFYGLYISELIAAPEITLSWEHSSYLWCTREELLMQCRVAADTYMQMVGDVVKAATEP